MRIQLHRWEKAEPKAQSAEEKKKIFFKLHWGTDQVFAPLCTYKQISINETCQMKTQVGWLVKAAGI